MASNVDVALRYAEEAWNAGHREVIDELFTADHVYHDPVVGELPPGPEGVRQRVAGYMEAFPDAQVRLEEPVVDGDWVVARWTWGGTNTGPIQGAPPTGKAAETTGMHMFRFRDGRIAETWVQFDALGLLTSIGLVTVGAPAAA